MATYERESRVAAPLATVWAFYSTIDGLQALTPRWLNLRVENVRRPSAAAPGEGEGEDEDEGKAGGEAESATGDADGGPLLAGTLVSLSARPFGVGPRQRWVSEITAREERDGVAYFSDEMRQGPFREWRHTHRFEALDGETLLTDSVVYETPYGTGVDAAAKLVFEPLFAYRHWRTRKLLE